MGIAEPVDILLVEDDEGHALLIQESLRRYGVVNKIHTMTDGQMALDYVFRQGEFAQKQNVPLPGLILLDLNLPKVDGFEVLRQVKENEELKSIPVMILTSTEDQREIDRSYQLGANNYITKPIDYQEFQEKVRHLGLFLEIISYPTGEL